MKTVALVPIKLNSERIPCKNLKRFSDGSPLISHILNSLSKCKNIDEIYVYCSDSLIKEYLPDNILFLKRSTEFDTAEADVNKMFRTFAESVYADIYVLAHATAPFQTSDKIDMGIEKVKSNEFDSVVAVKKMQEFVWKNGRPVNYSTTSIPRTQDLDPFYIETTGLYIYTRNVILKNKSRIGDKPYLLEMSEVESIDIDDMPDFQIADAVYMNLIKEGQ